MAVDDFTRICSKCRQDLPMSMFSRKNGGHAHYCKPCHKEYAKQHYDGGYKRIAVQNSTEWRRANPERWQEYQRQYYLTNKADHLVYSVEWSKKNPERRKVNYTKSRQNNLAVYRAREAAYRARNRAACNERINAWKAENKPLLAEYSRRRQAAIIKAVPPWSNQEAMRAFYIEAERLRKETGSDWHVDHIIPLTSKLVCGLHCEANLQVLPGKENLRKNNRYWPDMPNSGNV